MPSSEEPAANIKITSPSPHFGTQPLSFTLPFSTTIRELKGRISDTLDSKPDCLQQRLIYRGKILNDDSTISAVLGASANGEIINSEPSGFFTFLLALRPTITAPTSDQPNPPASLPSQGSTSHSPPAQDSNLTNAAAVSHLQRLVQVSANGSTTTETVVTTVQTSLRLPVSESFPIGSTYTTPRTRSFGDSPGASIHGSPPAARNGLLNPSPGMNRQLSASDTASAVQPLYLLHGPNGYRALVIAPRAQRFQAPVPLSIPAGGAASRANIGGNEHPYIPQLNIADFGMGAFYAQADGRQAPNANAPPMPAPVQQHPLAQRLQITPAEWIQRMRDRANHLWLAVRLIVFVILFSGGGSMRRTITLGSLALLIFIWQTGILNEQWANAQNLYRELFPRRPQYADPLSHTRSLNEVHQLPGAPLDPAITADLLARRDSERRTNRWREMFESIERGVTIFLASLVPGLHERHVEAHEERQRQRQQMAGAMATQEQQQTHQPQQQPPPERGDAPAAAANDLLVAEL